MAPNLKFEVEGALILERELRKVSAKTEDLTNAFKAAQKEFFNAQSL